MKTSRLKAPEYEIAEGGVRDATRGPCEEISDWTMDSQPSAPGELQISKLPDFPGRRNIATRRWLMHL